MPLYATPLSAGMDVRAAVDTPVVIEPQQRALIPTGLRVALPEGYDADYRGEIGVILINHSGEPFTVQRGDRIAQMVLARYEKIEWEPVDSLDDSDRGDGGFGHSGVK